MRTMEVPGRFVDARQNGATARLVIDSEPEPFIATPSETVAAQVRDARRGDFLQRTVLRSKLTGKTYRRDLAPCKAITHPAQFSGTGVLAILTIDLDRGMYSLDRDGVMAGAQVVYGSDRSLYVASRRYVRALELGQDVPEGVRTEIHRFDISNPERTVYRSTGTVPGFILNNYALSEFDGHLRVASTEEPQWFPDGTGTQSQSTVTVLKEDGARLVRVGSVTGLGQGERIYAVRFMGEKGYVVTFRQVDPLYTLDLKDHTAPKVVGELKIPGYSAYLHPVGENRLLGVGREGRDVQASLFDVSNMAAPQRLAQLNFGAGATPVESEPHAFLYWAPANLAVMPLSNYNPVFEGAVGVRIGPATLTQVGTIAHSDAARETNAPVERSFVIGEPRIHAVVARDRVERARRPGRGEVHRLLTCIRRSIVDDSARSAVQGGEGPRESADPGQRVPRRPEERGSGRRGYEGRGERVNAAILAVTTRVGRVWATASGWYETHPGPLPQAHHKSTLKCP